MGCFFSGEQLRNIEIFIGSKLNERAYLCGVYQGPAMTSGRVSVMCGEPLNGTSVTIVKNTHNESDSLTICEVFVIGELAGNDQKENQRQQV